MMKYAIIDSNSGYVWGEATATSPLDACRVIDLEISPGAPRFYKEISASDNSGSHYIVYEVPDSWHCDDGQDEKQIEECCNFPVRAYVAFSDNRSDGIVVDRDGREVDFEAVAQMMDDEIRERLHSQGFDSDQEFFAAYAKAHKDSTDEEFIPWVGGTW